MNVTQYKYVKSDGFDKDLVNDDECQLCFIFYASELETDDSLFKKIQESFSHATIVGCSTAGEIFGTNVLDNSAIVTAINFKKTKIKSICLPINMASSFKVGSKLAKDLPKKNLVHTFVFSDGLTVNGSELVKGITTILPESVSVTGGLAGDGDRFKSTSVLYQGKPESQKVVLVGLYSENLKIGFASQGGWDPFGPERLITKSKDNILYELDGEPALDLYKRYLGPQANELPSSGLLFPLSLRSSDDSRIVRTILSVNEKDKSMIFAGDVPEGSYAQLMKANFERLIDGASHAAKTCTDSIKNNAEFSLLISCVGRKLVLKQRIEEEVEAVQEVLGDKTFLTGFYSYGEISPFTPKAKCELHNQTMTITTLSEN